MDPIQQELYKQYRTSQDKYTYFMLAVAASAIAFSVQKTNDKELSWSLIPLCIAVLLWGVSFFFGCKTLRYFITSIGLNYTVLDLVSKNPSSSDIIKKNAEGVLNYNSDKATKYGNLQFYLIIGGAISYILWHILEMILRSL